MTENTVTVSLGLETGTAALFVQTASRFSSKVQVKMGDKIVNGKSIMGMISLGVFDGHNVTIVADGSDEEQAVSELIKFMQSTTKTMN